MIDVGGAALLGAAARNGAGVAAVGSPEHYPQLVARAAASSARRQRGAPPAARRGGVRDRRRLLRRDRRLPQPARRATSSRSASRWSSRRSRPAATARTRTSGPRSTARRPTAAARSPTRPSSRATRRRSTTCLDLDAAYRIARDYTTPDGRDRQAHRPGRARLADELVEAYRQALETDPVAAFGGIVGVNRELDGATAREIAANTYEAVVAPGYSEAALGILRQKAGPRAAGRAAGPDRGHARLRHRQRSTSSASPAGCSSRRIDELGLDRGQLQVVTKRRPTLEELTDLLFAWRAVRHVRSNAIVLARNARHGRGRRGPGAAARSRSRSRSGGPATGRSSR